MTVSAEEFIRRFLQHVVPAGLQRIRYYGFLANCHRTAKTHSLSPTARHGLLPTPSPNPQTAATSWQHSPPPTPAYARTVGKLSSSDCNFSRHATVPFRSV